MYDERAELFDSLRRYELNQPVSDAVGTCIKRLRDALLDEEPVEREDGQDAAA